MQRYHSVSYVHASPHIPAADTAGSDCLPGSTKKRYEIPPHCIFLLFYQSQISICVKYYAYVTIGNDTYITALQLTRQTPRPISKIPGDIFHLKLAKKGYEPADLAVPG